MIDPQPQITDEFQSSDHIQLLVGTDKCRRALKQLAIEVEVDESPTWLKERLETLGQKSINNVVDITNFVMLELGQPVHAFDYDKLAGKDSKEVTIREAIDGEKLTTLDGDTYELTKDMLVIADSEKALDIAGIKGGQVSGIDKNTSRVLLSVCSFDPTTIRRASQDLGLRTDASKRFENNVPADLSRRALDRLTELMVEVVGAKVSSDVCDVYPHPERSYKVGVTPERVNNILGTDIATDEMVDILERLGCEVELVIPRESITDEAQECVGAEYAYGASVLRDAPEKFDCSSFTSWLYVQGGITLPRISADQFVYSDEIEEKDLQPGDLIFSNTEKQEGGEIYYESCEFWPGTEIPGGVDHCGIYLGEGKVIHASRHNRKEEGGVEVEELAASKQFQNIVKYGRVPTADEEHIVATIPAWRTDLRIGIDLIEEIARVYGYDQIEATLPTDSGEEVRTPESTSSLRLERSNVGIIGDVLVSLGLSEVKTYSLVDSGDIELTNPTAGDKAFLRTTLRDNLLEVREINGSHLPVLEANSLHIFEIGQIFTAKAELTEIAIGVDEKGGDKAVADIFAQLAEILGIDIIPEIKNGIGTATFVDIESLEFAASDLPTYHKVPENSFRLPSSYPYVLRDTAVWTPVDTESDAVKGIIQAAAGDLLVATKLFDTYEKEGQISYAFKLVFQSDERTLSDVEVNEHMQAVEAALEENEGFSVR